jgi:hypothetical protein
LLLAGGITLAAFSLTFTHLAGSFGGPGFEDADGTAARFKSDAGVAIDGAGNLYIADAGNHTIRKVSPAGEVTTLAGLAETPGSSDGRGANARFNGPRGVALDGSGNVYVADTGNHTIRKITPAGVVSTFAGLAGANGFFNANGIEARFKSPQGVAVDGSNNVYVADTGNHSIRAITPARDVTTLAGTGSPGSANATGTGASFTSPTGLAWHSGLASILVADSGNRVVRQITLPGAVVTTFAGTMSTPGHMDGIPGRFFSPAGISVDVAGTSYVTDAGDHTIRSITSGGSAGSIAGLTTYPGPDDGTNTAAKFSAPGSLAVTGSTLFVADTGNHTVRKIAMSGPTNSVTTFAGLAQAAGNVVAPGSAARFNAPGGIAYYPSPPANGFAYVADTGNNAIKRVSADGSVVVLVAGGTFGYQNGTGAAAFFRSPKGLALDFGTVSVYVADSGNHCIRFVDLGGATSLYAGQPTTPGNANGDRLTTASFNAPRAVALSSSAIYVADTGNFLVRKIVRSSGVVSTLAGSGTFGSANGNGTAASFGILTGIWVDDLENVYVADSSFFTIRKITPSGDVTTFAGSCCDGPVDGIGTAAKFGYPGPTSVTGLTSTSVGYVADPQGHLIRTIDAAGAVGTAGGRANGSGTSDGTGTFARFNGAAHVSTLLPGALFVIEQNAIRFGSPEIADRAVVDSATGATGTPRQLDMSPQTATSWTWSVIRRPSGSTAVLSSTSVRNPTFTPDIPDLYVFRCVAKSASGSSISTVSLQGNGPAATLAVGYPGPEPAGTPFNIDVTARDADGNQADGYAGTIHFTSSDSQATLPADYTYVPGDHGTHTFSVTLRTSNVQVITAKDVSTPSIAGFNTVFVIPGPASALQLTSSLPNTRASGQPFTVTVNAVDSFANPATSYTGTVHFSSSDGTAVLPANYTFILGEGGTHTFTNGVTLNGYGAQSVTAQDVGNGALTATANFSVGQAAPGNLSATWNGTAIALSWTATPNTSFYEIFKSSGTSYVTLGTFPAATPQYNDPSVTANTTYVYKVRSLDSSMTHVSAFSAPDAATTMLFTDDPLVTGTTIVRGAHLTELRTAVNAFRAAAGLTAATWTDPTLTPGTTLIKAVHIQEVRNALAPARSFWLLPTITYTDPTLSAGTTPVRAIHVTEVRNGVK